MSRETDPGEKGLFL